MPLIDISGEDALANRRANPFNRWGDRDAPNRFEPIASPAFDVPFRMQPGEAVFTVGSCFARNVETELQARGFELRPDPFGVVAVVWRAEMMRTRRQTAHRLADVLRHGNVAKPHIPRGCLSRRENGAGDHADQDPSPKPQIPTPNGLHAIARTISELGCARRRRWP